MGKKLRGGKKIGEREFLHYEACLSQLKGNKKPYFTITGHTTLNGVTVSCGCIHDEILEHYPEFADLVKFHLRDIDGQPSYPLGNGLYLYAEGVDDKGDKVYLNSIEEQEEEKKAFNKKVLHEYILRYGLTDAPDTLEMFANNPYCISSSVSCSALEKIKALRDELRKPVKLIVNRNNVYLANHLLITLEEAEAIPAGLTKEEFNKRYIESNLQRWKDEANRLIEKYKLEVVEG